MFRSRTLLLIAVACGACAATAQAQVPAVRVAPDLSSRFQLNSVVAKPAPQSPLRYAAMHTARIAGITKTSVESRFGVGDQAKGEAGFLCGLLPHPDTSGAAAAFGHDPDGRFVGAKLRLAF